MKQRLTFTTISALHVQHACVAIAPSCTDVVHMDMQEYMRMLLAKAVEKGDALRLPSHALNMHLANHCFQSVPEQTHLEKLYRVSGKGGFQTQMRAHDSMAHVASICEWCMGACR